MARVFVYTMFIVGLMILLPSIGMDFADNQVQDLFQVITGQLEVSDFLKSLFDINTGFMTLGAIATGIVVGFLFKGTAENFLILPFITTVLILMLSFFQSIIKHVNGLGEPMVQVPIYLVMAMFSVGYIITMVEFFRGNT